ncbi:diaminopimelate epimerase [Candidatus Avelusimicrobium aviculae]|uniref:diaminopimelate epimerase n=1 Tax=Candidatus Avelusimicrobium aviculae TaxID=3416206 RepID=UPI003D0C3425
MKFTKYSGLGNDFILVNGFKEKIQNSFTAAQKLCDRHLGIGADGLVLVLPSESADLCMKIFNSDGSEAEMCGNASRCVPLFARKEGLTDKTTLTLETLAGPIKTEIKDSHLGLVSVDMGIPRLLRGQIPMTGDPTDTAVDVPLEIGGTVRYGTAVSMGNPHFVMFGPDVEYAQLRELGPLVEKNAAFPAKTNVEFVTVIDKKTLRMRVWERGAGITRACGTGACASVVAAVINGKTERRVTVKLDGGDLLIDWPEQKNIFMTGPAEEIFEGEWKSEL